MANDEMHSIDGVVPDKKFEDQETFSVKGSGRSEYNLKRIGDHYTCSCPAWRNQKGLLPNQRSCKHLKSVLGEEYESKRLKVYGKVGEEKKEKPASSSSRGSAAAGGSGARGRGGKPASSNGGRGGGGRNPASSLATGRGVRGHASGSRGGGRSGSSRSASEGGRERVKKEEDENEPAMEVDNDDGGKTDEDDKNKVDGGRDGDFMHSIKGVVPKKKLKDEEKVTIKGSGKTDYEIKRTGDHYTCSCPAWKIQKGKLPNERSCKHMVAIFGQDYETARLEVYGAIKSEERREETKERLKAMGVARRAQESEGSAMKKEDPNDDAADGDHKMNLVDVDNDGKGDKEGFGDGADGSGERNNRGNDIDMGGYESSDEISGGVAPKKRMKDQEIVEVEGSGSTNWKVKRTGDHYSCTCPAWAFQKSSPVDARTCKHIKEVLGEDYESARLALRGRDAGSAPTKGKKRKAKDDDDDDDDGASPRKKTKTKAKDESEGAKMAKKVMLANKYDLEGGKDVKGWWISEKLDGVRCYWDGEGHLYSRLGNPFSVPNWFIRLLPKGMTLDGELWHSRGSGGFSQTVSIVRTSSSKRWNEIRYQVFDTPSSCDLPFEERLSLLKSKFPNAPSVPIVPKASGASGSDGNAPGRKPSDGRGTNHVKNVVDLVEHVECKGTDHLMELLEVVEEMGGEGLMLRKPKSKYDFRRSAYLLKVKTFLDAEAEVIKHEPGKGKYKGMTGSLKCKMESGKEFSVGSGMSDEQRQDPPKIGTIIAYRFQEVSKDGAPRFPTFIGERLDAKGPKDAKVKGQKGDDGGDDEDEG